MGGDTEAYAADPNGEVILPNRTSKKHVAEMQNAIRGLKESLVASDDQINDVTIIKRTVNGYPKNVTKFNSFGGLEALLWSMELNSDSAAFQSAACNCLRCLVATDSGLVNKIEELHGDEAVLGILVNHVNSPETLIACCRLVLNLANTTLKTKDKLVGLGALTLLATAMQAHPRNVALQVQGDLASGMLTPMTPVSRRKRSDSVTDLMDEKPPENPEVTAGVKV